MTDHRFIAAHRRLIALIAVFALLFAALPALAEEPVHAPSWDPNTLPDPRDYLIPTPQSACFSRCGYALEPGCLFLEFRESGHVYIYTGVDYKIWNAFSRADSAEAYFEQCIQGNYPCYRAK